MTKYRVKFEVDLPEGVKRKEAQEFIEFELGARASLCVTNNKLQRTDLQSLKVSCVDVDEA